MKLVIMGPQGSGKSTQAKLLADKFNLPLLQTGQICREIAQQDTQEGQWMKKILDLGKLVPDKGILEIVNRLINLPENQRGFVLDGTPRSLSQAKKLKVDFDRVIYLRSSDQEGIKRLLKRARIEARDDDKPEVIKKRLTLYHQETEPILDYYRQKGILEEVDGERPIKVIFEDILKRLGKLGLLK